MPYSLWLKGYSFYHGCHLVFLKLSAQKIQAALVICGIFICEFAYMQLKNLSSNLQWLLVFLNANSLYAKIFLESLSLAYNGVPINDFVAFFWILKEYYLSELVLENFRVNINLFLNFLQLFLVEISLFQFLSNLVPFKTTWGQIWTLILWYLATLTSTSRLTKNMVELCREQSS